MIKILFSNILVAMLIISSCDREKDLPENENKLPDKNEVDFIKETHHPFLIVKKEQFEYLRKKADTEPWRSNIG